MRVTSGKNKLSKHMKKVLILGGGLSGLSTAVYLSEIGFQVEIIEASPKLGGRAYSFQWQEKNTIIDNGQHILMGCYSNTLNYIEKIKSKDKFYFQNSLKIDYITEKSKTNTLSVPEKFYPLNLLYSFVNFKFLSIKERKEILHFLFRIKTKVKLVTSELTVDKLLGDNGQSISTIRKFWELVVVSAMNTPIKIASAELFIEMIKIIFFGGKDSSNIIIPKVGLSESLIDPAKDFILNNGGKISCSERVLEIKFEDEKVKSVVTSKRTKNDFDFVVSAIPADSLMKIIPDIITNRLNIPIFEYSSIISVNLWLERNPLKEKFYGIIDGDFHWLFNKGKYISLIKSAANSSINLNKNVLIETANSEIRKYFNILNNIKIIDSKIIKERKATIIADSNSLKLRKNVNQNLNILFLAGDWTNTGLPSTIESSVKSGRMISEMISSQTLE